jgi:hypothetical protein
MLKARLSKWTNRPAAIAGLLNAIQMARPAAQRQIRRLPQAQQVPRECRRKKIARVLQSRHQLPAMSGSKSVEGGPAAALPFLVRWKAFAGSGGRFPGRSFGRASSHWCHNRDDERSGASLAAPIIAPPFLKIATNARNEWGHRRHGGLSSWSNHLSAVLEGIRPVPTKSHRWTLLSNGGAIAIRLCLKAT